MKRGIIYIIICILTLLIPVERMDIARLRPVQTVHLRKQADDIIIATDTDDIGRGTDALEALENMKQSASGIIYLDTAEYLLVSENATDQINKLRAHLKPSVSLYICGDEIDLQSASQYLQIHGNGPKLKTWEKGSSLPVLEGNEGKIILFENFEKRY